MKFVTVSFNDKLVKISLVNLSTLRKIVESLLLQKETFIYVYDHIYNAVPYL